ncbi:nitrite reductase (NAD(P)H) large subunit [Wickerhamomyces ciferrii]|uniref:Nitrite reductase (NAD(P)H) large subunit n=1 Tax=Wickerhamomyces ciferrii (strain ATCC 14091 / BCRC 22168 / CBS 111 / JCM 3599 / NBRC 0793 / NRRL Y-1031 F-60-10) TaxID=1206466 RepID=K0KIQ0_WICCF|nr:nitrite reductase (NAD(P)H) large subunit [Wickerhamomyces ciferrii]CCH42866.1 nitrite reductase (NAD(P)H) large subunit [Wickerhamomyces ciferrii]
MKVEEHIGGVPPLPHEKTRNVSQYGPVKRMVIVGLGMTGIAFLEKMLQNDTAEEYFYTVIGEEPYLAYNRVGLTEYFEHKNFDKLLLSPKTFYEERNRDRWDFKVDEAVTQIDKDKKFVITSKDNMYDYDLLVFATGSNGVLPTHLLPDPINGGSRDDYRNYRKMGCFVYRTIDDLNSMLDFSDKLTPPKDITKRAIVVGGGLLGLEAGKALLDMRTFDNVTVVHRSKWLLSQQMDEKGGGLLTDKVRDLGVTARVGTTVDELLFNEEGKLKGVKYNDGTIEDCQLLCYTIGIKPRDEVAIQAGINCSSRGGLAINNHMQTSDPNIYAIGECASWNDKTFGLIAPGITMADILSFNLIQAKFHSPKEFAEPDIGTRLKLMGVDVASFGDYFADKNGPKWLPKGYTLKKVRSLVYEDPIEGIYIKLILTQDGKYLLGGILVGNTKQFTKFTSIAKQRKPLPCPASEFILGKGGEDDEDADMLSDDTQVCSCQNISKGMLVESIRAGKSGSLGELKSNTKAGTSCGGCEPTMKAIFESEMKKMGKQLSNALCVHFKESRADLFSLIMVKQYKSFKQVMQNLGSKPEAAGCEICKPTIGSILSTLYNRHVLDSDVHGLQETNDKFLGNIQRNGTYSVIPRMSGGEITPEKLISIGNIAQKYDLYTKITGAQRVDLFGALKQDLPKIWEELYANGFESGQGYGKSLRNVKSCVGSTWCRYGIGDSVGLALRLEERYKGIRSPHKMKGGVSGCVRDCAEFHSKDFGLCAVQNGFNVYVGGNGGMKPAHAQLLKADCAPDQVIPLLDRYLMFYFRTADRLQRTARWLENLDGGIEYLKDVVVFDKLGICKELEDQMNELVGHYFDEWKEAVDQPDKKIFKQFANTDKEQENVEIIRERGQRRPADWPENDKVERKDFKNIKWSSTSWKAICPSSELPEKEAGSSTTVLVSDTQLALFRLDNKLYASQNMCGHKRAFVLSQGIISTDENDNVYISCPLHKKNYNLEQDKPNAGACKNDDNYSVALFDIKEDDDMIWINLPPEDELDEMLGTTKWKVKKDESINEGIATFKKLDNKFKIKVPVRAPIASTGGGGDAALDW